MSSGCTCSSNETRVWRSRLLNAAAIIWMVGGTLYFLVHFSQQFYKANQTAIDAFVTKLFG